MENETKNEKLIPTVELQMVSNLTEEELAKMIKDRDEKIKEFRRTGKLPDTNNDTKNYFFSENEKKNIIYFKLTNGLILKIDKANYTCYRFNEEDKVWQEDSVLFSEYEYGNLQGNIIDFSDVYEYGEKFSYGRHL